jgi:tetraacyldisaccharide 4'-kinase
MPWCLPEAGAFWQVRESFSYSPIPNLPIPQYPNPQYLNPPISSPLPIPYLARMNLSWLRPLLLPLSPLYGGMIQLRNLAYDRAWLKGSQAPVPVISVGNLSTGGTGKTPVAEAILRYFQAHHPEQQPAYLSRGYGRESLGYLPVDPQHGDSRMFGDEALQVARKFPECPVAVCADRREGIRRLVAETGATLIVLDDAFQHRRVARDLDLVVIDAQRPPHRDWLLPAGNLREPCSQLSRADLIIINKVADRTAIHSFGQSLGHYGKPLLFAQPRAVGVKHFSHQALQPLADLKGQPLLLLAGIGNPAFFRQQVEQLGAQVLDLLAFPDHHAFRPKDYVRIRQRYQALRVHQPELVILTTEKDFCRLAGQLPPEVAALPWAYLPIELEWLAREEHWRAALDKLVDQAKGGSTRI